MWGRICPPGFWHGQHLRAEPSWHTRTASELHRRWRWCRSQITPQKPGLSAVRSFLVGGYRLLCCVLGEHIHPLPKASSIRQQCHINKTPLLIQVTLERGTEPRSPTALKTDGHLSRDGAGVSLSITSGAKPMGQLLLVSPTAVCSGTAEPKSLWELQGGNRGSTLVTSEPLHQPQPPLGLAGMEVIPKGPAAIAGSCPSTRGHVGPQQRVWASLHPSELITGHREWPGCAGLHQGLTARHGAGGAGSVAGDSSPCPPAHRSPAPEPALRSCSTDNHPVPASRAGSRIKLMREAKLSPLKIAQWNFPLKKNKKEKNPASCDKGAVKRKRGTAAWRGSRDIISITPAPGASLKRAQRAEPSAGERVEPTSLFGLSQSPPSQQRGDQTPLGWPPDTASGMLRNYSGRRGSCPRQALASPAPTMALTPPDSIRGHPISLSPSGTPGILGAGRITPAGSIQGEPPAPRMATTYPAGSGIPASPSPATALHSKNEKHPRQPGRMKYLHVQRLELPAIKPLAPGLSPPPSPQRGLAPRCGRGLQGTTLPFPTILPHHRQQWGRGCSHCADPGGTVRARTYDPQQRQEQAWGVGCVYFRRTSPARLLHHHPSEPPAGPQPHQQDHRAGELVWPCSTPTG